jgi:hypothetical protein
LRDFWYEAQKKAKKTVRDRGFQGWNDVAVWRDFKSIYILEDIWPRYLEHVTSEWFTRRSQSGAGNRNWSIHGLECVWYCGSYCGCGLKKVVL